jgi:4-diphosphocytidyl-2-C-methyl-D-erythritol kinase
MSSADAPMATTCCRPSFAFSGTATSLRFFAAQRRCGAPATPLPGRAGGEHDLTVRAARLLQAETACQAGVDISLEKHLPLGGGLGGGSSDAATVLLALNHLWQLGLPRRRLQEIGLRSAPTYRSSFSAATPLPRASAKPLQAVELPPRWYVVVEPPVQVPTAAIFNAPELQAQFAADRRPRLAPGRSAAMTSKRSPAPAFR